MDDNSWSPCNGSHSLGSLPDHEFDGSQPEENNNVHTSSQSDPVTNQASNNCNSNGLMPMEYNEYGLPVVIGSEQFATRLGIIARSVVPPGIKDWKQVSKNMKEEIWNRIRVSEFVFYILTLCIFYMCD
ncbi:hypothetical protein MKX01_034746 [Papaver californicum]|nr:hypothetical protein MKX01_034746 [Papaver californicum]